VGIVNCLEEARQLVLHVEALTAFSHKYNKTDSFQTSIIDIIITPLQTQKGNGIKKWKQERKRKAYMKGP